MMRWRSLGAVVAAALTVATPAWSQEAEAAPTAEEKAIALGHDGLAAFERGAWSDAFERFDAAEQHTHSPVFVLYAARSLRHLGRLLEAEERLRSVAEERLPDEAPVAWQQARRDARAELAAIESRIPTLTVSVVGAEPVALRIDGDPAAPGRAVRLDPGEHRITAVGDGGAEQQRMVALAEGAHETIELRFESSEAPPVVEEGPLWPGIALLGLGVGGLAVGTATGIVAIGKADDIHEACGHDSVCPLEQQPDVDSAKRFALASTIGLVAGGVVSAVGITFLVVRPFGSEATESAVKLRLGPGEAAIMGRF